MNLDVSPEQINERYDTVLYGSDQIWNPDITGGFDSFYYAKNITNPRIVKAGVAVSCGDVSSVNGHEEFATYIQNFDYIAAREKSLAEYVNDCGGTAEHIFDPTFLLTAEEYIQIFGIPMKKEKPYLLVYELQRNPVLVAAAEKVAKEKGLRIKRICGYLNQTSLNKGGIFDGGPIDFLQLVANADYVMTNSFHGVAFSLIFRKDFNVLLPKSRTSRITELLTPLSLESRICLDESLIDSTCIDYAHVNARLEDGVQTGRDYIQKVLNEEK